MVSAVSSPSVVLLDSLDKSTPLTGTLRGATYDTYLPAASGTDYAKQLRAIEINLGGFAAVEGFRIFRFEVFSRAANREGGQRQGVILYNQFDQALLHHLQGALRGDDLRVEFTRAILTTARIGLTSGQFCRLSAMVDDVRDYVVGGHKHDGAWHFYGR